MNLFQFQLMARQIEEPRLITFSRCMQDRFSSSTGSYDVAPLEGQPQPKLDLPRVAAGDDLSEINIVDVAYWFAVSRMVESVEEFCAELQIHAFLKALASAQGKVEVLFSRSTKIWLGAGIIPQRER